MSDNRLKMLTHIPADSDFSLNAAIEHFQAASFADTRLQSELTTGLSGGVPSGFRVWFDHWSIVSWLEQGEEVLVDSEVLSHQAGLRVPPSVIAACSLRLSVWSDPGITPEREEWFRWFAEQLSDRFAAIHYDHFAQKWL
jgi:hypothetical protein